MLDIVALPFLRGLVPEGRAASPLVVGRRGEMAVAGVGPQATVAKLQKAPRGAGPTVWCVPAASFFFFFFFFYACVPDFWLG
jgi:hypothetical protein